MNIIRWDSINAIGKSELAKITTEGRSWSALFKPNRSALFCCVSDIESEDSESHESDSDEDDNIKVLKDSLHQKQLKKYKVDQKNL